MTQAPPAGRSPLAHGSGSQESAKAARAFAAAVLLSTLVRAGLALAYPLSGDEAYYWDCSRHPDWSSFDQPPLVLWSIGLARQVLGETTLAVRTPSLLAGIVLALSLRGLVRRLGGDDRGALRAWLVLHATPIFLLGTAYASTDALLAAAYAACTWAAVAIAQGERRAWYGFGLCAGLGFLAKFPMVVVLLGLPGLWLESRPAREDLRGPHPWIAAVLGLGLTTPVWIWAAQHHGDNLTFQFSRMGKGFRPDNLLGFLGAGLALLSVGVGLAAARSWWRSRAWTTPGLRTFRWVAGAPLAFFAYASLRGHVGVHWGGPTLLLSVVPLVLDPRPALRTLRAGVLFGVLLISVLLAVPLLPEPAIAVERALRSRSSRPDKLELPELVGHDALVRRLEAELGPGERAYTDGYSDTHTVAFVTAGRLTTRFTRVSGAHGLASLYWYRPADELGHGGVYFTEKAHHAAQVLATFERWRELAPLPVLVDGVEVRRYHLWRVEGLRDARLVTRLED